MPETIFSKLIRGEIPCHRVYENDHVLAFLDVNPISPGHTLVIPKEHAVTLADLSPDSAAALGRALPALCRAVQQATGCPGYNLLQNNGPVAGQVVMHAHIHIIPRTEGDHLDMPWPAQRLANGPELAATIRHALGHPSPAK